MKRTKVLFSIVMLIGIYGIVLPGYADSSHDKTSITEIRQETAALLRTLKDYSVEQKDEALAAAQTALKKLDRRIDALEADVDRRWGKMDTSARENARASLKALRRQRTQVAEWYGSLKSSADGSWVHIKEGFSAAYKALNNAWEKTEGEFASGRQGRGDQPKE